MSSFATGVGVGLARRDGRGSRGRAGSPARPRRSLSGRGSRNAGRLGGARPRRRTRSARSACRLAPGASVELVAERGRVAGVERLRRPLRHGRGRPAPRAASLVLVRVTVMSAVLPSGDRAEVDRRRIDRDRGDRLAHVDGDGGRGGEAVSVADDVAEVVDALLECSTWGELERVGGRLARSCRPRRRWRRGTRAPGRRHRGRCRWRARRSSTGVPNSVAATSSTGVGASFGPSQSSVNAPAAV